jgi:hypothetical protein
MKTNLKVGTKISQSNRTAVMAALTIIAVGLLEFSISHGLCIGDDRVITA